MSSSDKERSRTRKTRLSVFIADRIARVVITAGGIATIVAICAVAVFLVLVSLPLFFSPTLTVQPERSIHSSSPPWLVAVDQDQRLVAIMDDVGVCRLFELSTGKLLTEQPFPGSMKPTAFALSKGTEKVAAGLADGKICIGSVRFKDTFSPPDETTASLVSGEYRTTDRGVVVRIDGDQIRLTELSVSWGEPIATGRSSPITRIDFAEGQTGLVFATAEDSGEVFVHRVLIQKIFFREKKSLGSPRPLLYGKGGSLGRCRSRAFNSSGKPASYWSSPCRDPFAGLTLVSQQHLILSARKK